MKVAVFSSKKYEIPFFEAANKTHQHTLQFFEEPLNETNAPLAKDFPAVSCFVNDHPDATTLKILAANGTKLLALRSAGFNHVDLAAAHAHDITVVRVPDYSPYAVAEFAVTLILALNRKIIRAYSHVREHDFLLKGLMGFDCYNKTVGIVGTGKIGQIFAQIMHGFGCTLLAHDPIENDECKQLGVSYVNFNTLCKKSDIISLHCPLTADTHHLINAKSLEKMQDGMMIINTGRGGLIDTNAVIDGLKSQKIAYLGIDVYEEEESLFFQDLSEQIIQDDVFARLQTFPNVIITGHQAFFTKEAVSNICETTLQNITGFAKGEKDINEVKTES